MNLSTDIFEKYDIDIVGWGMKLSGGQKQWLSIACVFRDYEEKSLN